MKATRSCKKPGPVGCEYVRRLGDIHVVRIVYDSGVMGELEIPADPAERDTAEHREYVATMVFGRHQWDKKTPEEYAHLDRLISSALAEAE